MTQEDKELLLKDLCARLPYGVKVKTRLKIHTLKGLFYTEYGGVMGCLLNKSVPNWVSPKTVNYPLEQIKPYLFPLSSMTEEQKKELADVLIEMQLKAISDVINGEDVAAYEIDFYNKHHIDYRGLIPKGLAIDATGKNIY